MVNTTSTSTSTSACVHFLSTLKSASHDSMPRDALWGVLKNGVIKSFHDSMLAQVRVGRDSTTNSIEVKNGVQEGCTLAPSLFNIYFSAMVACLRARCPEAGFTKSQFADDAAVYASTRAAFERDMSEFVQAALELGLTVSIQKTKGIIIGGQLTLSDCLTVAQ